MAGHRSILGVSALDESSQQRPLRIGAPATNRERDCAQTNHEDRCHYEGSTHRWQDSVRLLQNHDKTVEEVLGSRKLGSKVCIVTVALRQLDKHFRNAVVTLL